MEFISVAYMAEELQHMTCRLPRHVTDPKLSMWSICSHFL